MCLCKFSQTPPIGSGDSVDNEQPGRQRRRDPHQNNISPLRLGD